MIITTFALNSSASPTTLIYDPVSDFHFVTRWVFPAQWEEGPALGIRCQPLWAAVLDLRRVVFYAKGVGRRRARDFLHCVEHPRYPKQLAEVMSEFSKVVAWDKNGPIEVEMYLVVNGKKVVIQGDVTIDEFKPVTVKPVPMPMVYAGKQWVT
jgi:hypothetical protein